jgi:hypothetical protein
LGIELQNVTSGAIEEHHQTVESAIKDLLPTRFGDILEIVLLSLHIMWFHKTSKEIEEVGGKVDGLEKKIDEILETVVNKKKTTGSRRRHQHQYAAE